MIIQYISRFNYPIGENPSDVIQSGSSGDVRAMASSRASAIMCEQLNKLDPFIGNVYEPFFFRRNLPDVLLVPCVQSEVGCYSARHRRLTKRSQHDSYRKGRRRALPTCQAGEGAPPRDPCLIILTRSCDGEDLRLLSLWLTQKRLRSIAIQSTTLPTRH